MIRNRSKALTLIILNYEASFTLPYSERCKWFSIMPMVVVPTFNFRRSSCQKIVSSLVVHRQLGSTDSLIHRYQSKAPDKISKGKVQFFPYVIGKRNGQIHSMEQTIWSCTIQQCTYILVGRRARPVLILLLLLCMYSIAIIMPGHIRIASAPWPNVKFHLSYTSYS